MRGGPLSEPTVVRLLSPFIVTSWHGANESAMPQEVKEIFTGSALSKDPARTNLFAYVLDAQGQVVHSFHGLPTAGRARGPGRSNYAVEIAKALAALHLSEDKTEPQNRPVVLPDLKAPSTELPAGVRIFLRPGAQDARRNSTKPVIELVSMQPEEWAACSYPAQTREVKVELLRSWLVRIYPAGIRTADQSKPFEKFTGSLKLEPAGADQDARYALLRGNVVLSKKDDTESAFEGKLEVVLSYGPAGPQVRSLRGVMDGDYTYRMRGGADRISLRAAIESRPDERD